MGTRGVVVKLCACKKSSQMGKLQPKMPVMVLSDCKCSMHACVHASCDKSGKYGTVLAIRRLIILLRCDHLMASCRGKELLQDECTSPCSTDMKWILRIRCTLLTNR